jgi:murein DD-endopeptidase MepM/ murein hydrolase activator NlpD
VHTVVKGDTLSKLAEKYCGDFKSWRNIFQANRYKIRDPNLIYPGQKFQIACSAGEAYSTESGEPWYKTKKGRKVVEAAGGKGAEFITHMPLPRGSFRVSSGFGKRSAPRTKAGRASHNHKGLDLAAPQGTPVGAAGAGVVVRAGWNGGYGMFVEIQHPDGMITRYGHMKRGSILVKKGEKVFAGQMIGQVGSTGKSTGPHLHFEIRKPNRVAMNPAPVLGIA